MPSLKSSTSYRQSTDRPSLKERAAGLKASAARVSRERPKNAGVASASGYVERVADPIIGFAAAGPDPVFATIMECERRRAKQAALYAVCGDRLEEDPSWAVHDPFYEASWNQWNDMVLKTVPQTAEGCRALAAYACSWFKYQGVGEEEDGPVILDLIARSPMLRSGGIGSSAAADASTETADADATLLELGHEFDAARAAWRFEADAARATEFEEDPVEATAFEAIEPWAEAISRLPATTVPGLAVRARAALHMTWAAADFPDLVKEETDHLYVLRLIEACCAAAGVDHLGRPIPTTGTITEA